MSPETQSWEIVRNRSIPFLSSARKSNAEHIFEDIYAVSDIGTMKEKLASLYGKRKIRFYSGYAGWTSGQLEKEILIGSWKLVEGKADTVFKEVFPHQWRHPQNYSK